MRFVENSLSLCSAVSEPEGTAHVRLLGTHLAMGLEEETSAGQEEGHPSCSADRADFACGMECVDSDTPGLTTGASG